MSRRSTRAIWAHSESVGIAHTPMTSRATNASADAAFVGRALPALPGKSVESVVPAT